MLVGMRIFWEMADIRDSFSITQTEHLKPKHLHTLLHSLAFVFIL
jgi:hypothetical protein